MLRKPPLITLPQITSATAPPTSATPAAATPAHPPPSPATTLPAAEVPLAVADGFDPVAAAVPVAPADAAEAEMDWTGLAVSVKAQLSPVQRHVLATGSNQAVEQLVEMCDLTPIAVFCDGTGLSGVGSTVGHP